MINLNSIYLRESQVINRYMIWAFGCRYIPPKSPKPYSNNQQFLICNYAILYLESSFRCNMNDSLFDVCAKVTILNEFSPSVYCLNFLQHELIY